MIRSFSLFAAAALCVQPALAQFNVPTLPEPFVNRLNPLVQDFENGTANFGRFDDQGVDDLLDGDVFTAPGGVGGSQQLQTVASLDDFSQGVLWRAEAILGTNLLAFTGDYFAANVTTFSATVQHDAPIDLDFSLRFATRNAAFDSDNFPAQFAGGFPAVTPNTLTELSVTIVPENFDPEAPLGPPFFSGFNDVFDDITNIQVLAGLPDGFAAVSQSLLNAIEFGAAEVAGVTLPADGLLGNVFDDFTTIEDVPLLDENGEAILTQFGPNAGQPATFTALIPTGNFVGFNLGDDITFGLDNFTLTAVPEPGAVSLIAFGCLGALARRQRKGC